MPYDALHYTLDCYSLGCSRTAQFPRSNVSRARPNRSHSTGFLFFLISVEYFTDLSQQVLDGVGVSRADATHAKMVFTGKARTFLRGFRSQRLEADENQVGDDAMHT